MKKSLFKIFSNRLIKYTVPLLMLIFITAILMPSENFFAHFLMDYAVHGVFVFLFLSIFFLFVNQKWLMYGAVFTTGIVSVYLHSLTNQVSSYIGIDDDQIEDAFDLSLFDLKSYNGNFDSLASYLEYSDKDIIALQGISGPMKEALLRNLGDIYTSQIYYNLYEEDGKNGLGILSKYYLSDADSFKIGEQINMRATALLNSGKAVNLVNIQPPEPNMVNIRSINSFYKNLSWVLSKESKPYICMGNFNMVPWDKTLLSFKESSYLYNSKYVNAFVHPTVKNYSRQISVNPKIHIMHSDKISCADFHNFILAKTPNIEGAMGTYVFKKEDRELMSIL